MTGDDKQKREALSRLADALVEDVLAASDQEILAEFIDARGDPAVNAAQMRALVEKSLLNANKSHMRAAQAALAASRAGAPIPKVVSMQNVRGRLRRALAACPPNIKLTLAARNESEMTDSDVLGMLQDLEELGIVPPDDESGGRT